MKREYKTGTQYCFWRWKVIDPTYLTRLHVVQTPWFSICVHIMTGPDPAIYLHDHPVTFLSLILWGNYTEDRKINGHLSINHRRWFNFIRANRNDIHSIRYVKSPTITLCFMGPRRQEWGFHTPDGWVSWKEYNKMGYR